MNLSEKVELSKLIIQYSLEKYPQIFAACSFGKDSCVIVDLAININSNLQFIGIDTGYEFPETLAFAEELINERNIIFTWARPEPHDVERINAEYEESFIKDGQSKCCAMKIPAIERHLPNYDAWITGLRRDETEHRKNIPIIEDGKIVKVNPIAFWTQDDVWEYIKQNKLKYHPLYDEGYLSLGCKPCTIKGETQSGGGRQGKFERAGRFNGSDHEGEECGLRLEV